MHIHASHLGVRQKGISTPPTGRFFPCTIAGGATSPSVPHKELLDSPTAKGKVLHLP